MLEKDRMFWLEGIVIAVAVIYVSSIFFAKQQMSDKGKDKEEGEDHSA